MEYIPAKTIVTRTKTRDWFGTDYNMNIYKGCCHGCIYCDSRSECYHIPQFDTVRAKENALQIIRDDLRRKVKKGVIQTGSMSDPYNPFEKELCLTRRSLELINAFEFGVSIATKSTLIQRDMDLLTEIREHSPVLCKLTITTADDSLARLIEPGAPPSSERFQTLAQLSKSGLFTGVLLMPVLPFLEDNMENINTIVKNAAECDAKFVYPFFGLTMREGQREWFYNKLTEVFPTENYVLRYRKRFGLNYTCFAQNSKKIWQMFIVQCEKYGLLYDMKNIIHAYKGNYGYQQLSLFD